MTRLVVFFYKISIEKPLFTSCITDFELYPMYSLNQFDIPIISANCLLFFFFLHNQLSNLLENTSYLSMFSHKKRKKDLIKNIFKETLIDQCIYFLTTFLTIIGLAIIIDHFFGNTMTLTPSMIGLLGLFLLKYFTWIFIEVICLKLYASIHPISHEEVVPYLTFFSTMIIDFYLGTSFYNFVGSSISILKYECTILSLGIFLIGLLIYKILYSKELFV